MMRFPLFSIVAAAVLASACGPDEPATFTRVQSEVFTTSCVFSACHKGAAPAGEMNLETGAYEAIVDVPAVENPAKVRVKPGDPAGSYMLDKLEGRQVSGDQMPPGATLEKERLELVRRWIEAGAPND